MNTEPNNVLIVDDSDVVLKLSRNALKAKGYRVDQATNGEMALAMMKARNYSLVMMDVEMPGMDGIEATSLYRDYEAREGNYQGDKMQMSEEELYKGDSAPASSSSSNSAEYRRRRIVGVSAGLRRDRALAAGMDEFIAKPLRIEDMMRFLIDNESNSITCGGDITMRPNGSPRNDDNDDDDSCMNKRTDNDAKFDSTPDPLDESISSGAVLAKRSRSVLAHERPSIDASFMSDINLNGTTTNVLIVDDSEVVLKLSRNAFKAKGYRVDQATNGEMALAMMKANRYDLVVMDIMMPVMDGISAASLFRDFESSSVIGATSGDKQGGKKQLIIGMSSISDSSSRSDAISAGFDDFLAKPLKRDAVDDILSRHI